MKRLSFLITAGLFLAVLNFLSMAVAAQEDKKEPLLIRKCQDFVPNGKGDNPEWDKCAWIPLQKLDEGGETDSTRFKVLYSANGIYVVFSGADSKITTSFDKDFEELFQADVFEVFLQPDPAMPLYLEYEVNPLDKELVLLIPNLATGVGGWIPWHYEGRKKVVKKVVITGGSPAPGATIRGWSAELFFPWPLFNPMAGRGVKPGDVWNVNFYRLDYDSGKMIKWAWSPVEKSFHEFKKFRPVRFE